MSTTPDTAHDEETLDARMKVLAAGDPVIARAWKHYGTPKARPRPAGFTGLVMAIVGQQLSTHAAGAIYERLLTLLGNEMTPPRLLAAHDDDLRGVGLSRAKAKYLRALAERIVSGQLDLEALARTPDEEAIATLIELPGFGRWSAEVFLLFAYHRDDIFPAGDLALREAARRLLELDERPSERDLREIATRWAPHRGTAAMFLWHSYRGKPL